MPIIDGYYRPNNDLFPQYSLDNIVHSNQLSTVTLSETKAKNKYIELQRLYSEKRRKMKNRSVGIRIAIMAIIISQLKVGSILKMQFIYKVQEKIEHTYLNRVL